MSPTLIVATVIVFASCVGFVIVGSVYKWDVTSVGYGRWTRGVGAASVLGMAGAIAWARVDQPAVAIAIGLAGAAIAWGFVVIHKRLSEKVRDTLS